MARRVVWTDAALNELREVAHYVAQSDATEAGRIVDAALAGADGRVSFPEAGSIVAELESEQVREIIIKRVFRLIYEISDDTITVLAFIHARKRLARKAVEFRRGSN